MTEAIGSSYFFSGGLTKMFNSRMILAVVLALIANVASAAEYKPGEVLVKFKTGLMRSRAAMTQLYKDVGVRSVERFSGIERLVLEDNVKVEDALVVLQKSDFVDYAQPNF